MAYENEVKTNAITEGNPVPKAGAVIEWLAHPL
jgi:hypothetical protein